MNDREPTPGLDMRERVFSGKKLLLGFENFVITGFPLLVAVGRYSNGIATGADCLGLFRALLSNRGEK